MPLPNLAPAVGILSRTVYFKFVTKKLVDYEMEENVSNTQGFYGSLQPLPEQELIIKPEGQRTWKYWRLYTAKLLMLDAEIIDNTNKRYRVMSVGDWGQAGYFTYQVAEGPTP